MGDKIKISEALTNQAVVNNFINYHVAGSISVSLSEATRITGGRPDQKVVLDNVLKILQFIHDTLKSAVTISVIRGAIPLLLVSNPRSVSDIKFNVDKYLQYAIYSKEKLNLSVYQLWAFQYVSDYCVGLSFSESQMNQFFVQERSEAKDIAREVHGFCLKHAEVAGTRVNDLWTMCKMFMEGRALEGAFAKHSDF